jgi:AcrR family transcriptional regulator
LLDRAAALVFAGGVDALSLRRLAGDVGTSTTAVYSLFGNKDGLLDNLYGEAARRFGERLAEVALSEDPVEDLVRLGIAYRDYALSEPHLYAIMFALRVTGVDGVPGEDEADTADDTDDDDDDDPGGRARTLGPLVEAVRRAQVARRLRDVPAEQVALACWGVAHGLVSLELAGTVPSGLDVAAGYEDSLRAMVDGWRAR